VSNGARAEATEETLRQFYNAAPKTPGHELERVRSEADLAIAAGDFARAALLVKSEAAQIEADPHLASGYAPHYRLAGQRVDVAREIGDEAGARRAADDFVARSGAWQDNADVNGVDLAIFFARFALPPGGPTPGFEMRRQAWIDARVASGAYRGQIWSYGHAAAALTEPEARSALDALARLGPPSPAPALSRPAGSPEAAAGHVYLLAGQVDEAIVHLRRAVAQCDLFLAPRDHVRAALDLGRALERKGDDAGACGAYGEVLARWGHASPRSVTADEARLRVKALACARE
jgi:eukaryotic-like serine/threonine-protein kinase